MLCLDLLLLFEFEASGNLMTLHDLNLKNCPRQNNLHDHKFSFFSLMNKTLFFLRFLDWRQLGFSSESEWNLENSLVIWAFFLIDSRKHRPCVRNATDKDFLKRICLSDLFVYLLKPQINQWGFCTLWSTLGVEFKCSKGLEFKFKRFHRVSFWHGKEFIRLSQVETLRLSWIWKIQQKKILSWSFPSNLRTEQYLFILHRCQLAESCSQGLWNW